MSESCQKQVKLVYQYTAHIQETHLHVLCPVVHEDDVSIWYNHPFFFLCLVILIYIYISNSYIKGNHSCLIENWFDSQNAIINILPGVNARYAFVMQLWVQKMTKK